MEELDELKKIAWKMISAYDNSEDAYLYVESCEEEWELYSVIHAASMHLPFEKIRSIQEISSTLAQAIMLEDINMGIHHRPDNRLEMKKISNLQDTIAAKDRIIEMLKQEADAAGSQIDELRQSCDDLASENAELKSRHIELWFIAVLERWQKRHQRRDLRRLNRMFEKEGTYTDVQQMFLLDLVKEGVSFKEIKKTFPSSEISIEVMQKIRECM